MPRVGGSFSRAVWGQGAESYKSREYVWSQNASFN